MYIIINRTKGNKMQLVDSLAAFETAEEALERDEEVIIISTFSNTINIPDYHKLDTGNVIKWIKYPLPLDLLKTL
jgi:hypothetical protein